MTVAKNPDAGGPRLARRRLAALALLPMLLTALPAAAQQGPCSAGGGAWSDLPYEGFGLTEQERLQLRTRLRDASGDQQRDQIRDRERDRIRERARDCGVALPPDPTGPGGRGQGQGQGQGGGGGGGGAGKGGG